MKYNPTRAGKWTEMVEQMKSIKSPCLALHIDGRTMIWSEEQGLTKKQKAQILRDYADFIEREYHDH